MIACNRPNHSIHFFHGFVCPIYYSFVPCSFDLSYINNVEDTLGVVTAMETRWSHGRGCRWTGGVVQRISVYLILVARHRIGIPWMKVGLSQIKSNRERARSSAESSELKQREWSCLEGTDEWTSLDRIHVTQHMIQLITPHCHQHFICTATCAMPTAAEPPPLRMSHTLPPNL